jgi:hypothetical protein
MVHVIARLTLEHVDIKSNVSLFLKVYTVTCLSS